MSDRTSQYLCAVAFEQLGKKVTPETKRVAKALWKAAAKCDFHPRDMEVDKELIRLGLAKKGRDPDLPDDGDVTLYKNVDGGFDP